MWEISSLSFYSSMAKASEIFPNAQTHRGAQKRRKLRHSLSDGELLFMSFICLHQSSRKKNYFSCNKKKLLLLIISLFIKGIFSITTTQEVIINNMMRAWVCKKYGESGRKLVTINCSAHNGEEIEFFSSFSLFTSAHSWECNSFFFIRKWEFLRDFI